MLVINRKQKESLVLGGGITVTVVEIRGDKVRLGIVCPPETPVHRQEVYDAIHGRQLLPPLPRSPVEMAFLKAILEEPDDESVRLIFADWLEEQSNPYGEFIRIQCQLATLPPEDGRCKDLRHREHLLWCQHGETWRAYLPPVLRQASFERGFVETVHLSADDFLSNAEEIFAAAPVRRLQVGPCSWGEQEAVRLAASLHMAPLTTLVLRGSRISDAGALALAGSPHLTGLMELDLSKNDIREAGARALAVSSSLAGLRKLDLSANPIGEVGMRALRSRFSDRVLL